VSLNLSQGLPESRVAELDHIVIQKSVSISRLSGEVDRSISAFGVCQERIYLFRRFFPDPFSMNIRSFEDKPQSHNASVFELKSIVV